MNQPKAQPNKLVLAMHFAKQDWAKSLIAKQSKKKAKSKR